ncbi:hypothetical protein [Nonomuraea sp. NPDC050643]|uniref:hypothetical protein n=1 Tax=Nonomuraea sp. NPDC050643 TaxID=3155660 RepID=UPI003411BE04
MEALAERLSQLDAHVEGAIRLLDRLTIATAAPLAGTGAILATTIDPTHLHHSSVARRLDHLSRALGIDPTDPTGLIRARLALTTWRLLND